MSTITLDYTGTTVIVTGGTKGVGKGIAEKFLDLGADVLVCARSAPDHLPRAGSRTASFTTADVRDPENCQAVIDTAMHQFGRIDTLVNNAGGSPMADAATASPRFSESIIKLNLLSPLWLAQAANKVMSQQDEGGNIINISSISGVRPSPATAAYGAAKAGLINLGQTLAMEWGPKVRVNTIVAGMIETESSDLHYGGKEQVDAIGKRLPLGRMATPNDIAQACLYLASPLASYITGTEITIHGGGEPPYFHEQSKPKE